MKKANQAIYLKPFQADDDDFSDLVAIVDELESEQLVRLLIIFWLHFHTRIFLNHFHRTNPAATGGIYCGGTPRSGLKLGSGFEQLLDPDNRSRSTSKDHLKFAIFQSEILDYLNFPDF